MKSKKSILALFSSQSSKIGIFANPDSKNGLSSSFTLGKGSFFFEIADKRIRAFKSAENAKDGLHIVEKIQE